MKFKNLRYLTEQFSSLIKENSSSNVAAPEWNPNAGLGDVDSKHLYPEKECNRDRLNFWLKTLNPSDKPVFDVHGFMNTVRMKLNLVGYDIPFNRQTELSDNMQFEMTQFGGRSGMNEQGQYFKDDGISHKNNGKGLTLVVKMTDADGAKMVDMKIQEN